MNKSNQILGLEGTGISIKMTVNGLTDLPGATPS